MRLYETGIIFQPELPDDQLNELISRIEGAIEKGGGKITEINQWGVRKLAYRIARQKSGYYTFFKYAGMPTLVAELEYQLRVFESVIRFLTIKLEDNIEEEDLGSIQKVHKKPEPVKKPEEKKKEEKPEEAPVEEPKQEAKVDEPKEAADQPVEEEKTEKEEDTSTSDENPPAEQAKSEEETTEEDK